MRLQIQCWNLMHSVHFREAMWAYVFATRYKGFLSYFLAGNPLWLRWLYSVDIIFCLSDDSGFEKKWSWRSARGILMYMFFFILFVQNCLLLIFLLQFFFLFGFFL